MIKYITRKINLRIDSLGNHIYLLDALRMSGMYYVVY